MDNTLFLNISKFGLLKLSKIIGSTYLIKIDSIGWFDTFCNILLKKKDSLFLISWISSVS